MNLSHRFNNYYLKLKTVKSHDHGNYPDDVSEFLLGVDKDCWRGHSSIFLVLKLAFSPPELRYRSATAKGVPGTEDLTNAIKRSKVKFAD